MSDSDDRGLLQAELTLRRDRTPSPFGRAVWQLVLGEADAGLQTLREHYAEMRGQPGGGYHRAVLPLLFGDSAAASSEARLELEQPSDRWVPGWREYRRALLALTAADEERASEEVRALEVYAAEHAKLPSGPPSSVEKIPAGILTGDAERVSEGLDDYLGWHLRSARSRSDKFNSELGVICLDAIIALLLAHRRGLVPRVAGTYRRAELPLLAVYLAEWQGQPVDRGTKLSLEADLVATPWLAANGLQLPGIGVAAVVRGGRRAPKRVSLREGQLDSSIVAGYLRQLVDGGRGSAWQLMSWALMIGDLEAARRHLRQESSAARRHWQETRPAQGGFLRRLVQQQELPNPNYVREHFALALVAGDEPALRETSGVLRAWMDAVGEDGRRRGITMPGHPYGHAAGHLDLLADLLQPTGAAGLRAPVETVFGTPIARTACLALVKRDGAMLGRALNDALEEHVRQLERQSSPPPPLHGPAIEFAAAARRLGIPVQTDARYAAYPVPITIRDPPGPPGRMGRLPCDLMGTQLFT